MQLWLVLNVIYYSSSFSISFCHCKSTGDFPLIFFDCGGNISSSLFVAHIPKIEKATKPPLNTSLKRGVAALYSLANSRWSITGWGCWAFGFDIFGEVKVAKRTLGLAKDDATIHNPDLPRTRCLDLLNIAR
jgi:hypothetical protein